MNNELNYVLLKKDDKDIKLLKQYLLVDEIRKYISLSDNYFEYSYNNDFVYDYKIYLDNVLIGDLTVEEDKDVLYLSIWILPKYWHHGYAKSSVEWIISKYKNTKFTKIKVGIDEKNIASKKLFKNLGFIYVNSDEEIENYVYYLKK